MKRARRVDSRICIAAALLLATGGTVAANELHSVEQPRFAIETAAFERSDMHDSADKRYRVDVRIEQEPTPAKHGGAFALRAKLVDATATACGVTTDALFSDGFE